MVATLREQEEEFVAQVTEIAYQAVLRRGLSTAFADVELALWREIREAYVDRIPQSKEVHGVQRSATLAKRLSRQTVA